MALEQDYGEINNSSSLELLNQDEGTRMSSLDLYEDLLVQENQESSSRILTIQEVISEKRDLAEQNKVLLQQLVEKSQQLHKALEEKTILQKSFDSLLTTAKLEIVRKNNLLKHYTNRPFQKPTPQTPVTASKRNTQLQQRRDTKKITQSLKGKRINDEEIRNPKFSIKSNGSPMNHPSISTVLLQHRGERMVGVATRVVGCSFDEIPTHLSRKQTEILPTAAHPMGNDSKGKNMRGSEADGLQRAACSDAVTPLRCHGGSRTEMGKVASIQGEEIVSNRGVPMARLGGNVIERKADENYVAALQNSVARSGDNSFAANHNVIALKNSDAQPRNPKLSSYIRQTVSSKSDPFKEQENNENVRPTLRKITEPSTRNSRDVSSRSEKTSVILSNSQKQEHNKKSLPEQAGAGNVQTRNSNVSQTPNTQGFALPRGELRSGSSEISHPAEMTLSKKTRANMNTPESSAMQTRSGINNKATKGLLSNIKGNSQDGFILNILQREKNNKVSDVIQSDDTHSRSDKQTLTISKTVIATAMQRPFDNADGFRTTKDSLISIEGKVLSHELGVLDTLQKQISIHTSADDSKKKDDNSTSPSTETCNPETTPARDHSKPHRESETGNLENERKIARDGSPEKKSEIKAKNLKFSTKKKKGHHRDPGTIKTCNVAIEIEKGRLLGPENKVVTKKLNFNREEDPPLVINEDNEIDLQFVVSENSNDDMECADEAKSKEQSNIRNAERLHDTRTHIVSDTGTNLDVVVLKNSIHITEKISESISAKRGNPEGLANNIMGEVGKHLDVMVPDIQCNSGIGTSMKLSATLGENEKLRKTVTQSSGKSNLDLVVPVHHESMLKHLDLVVTDNQCYSGSGTSMEIPAKLCSNREKNPVVVAITDWTESLKCHEKMRSCSPFEFKYQNDEIIKGMPAHQMTKFRIEYNEENASNAESPGESSEVKGHVSMDCVARGGSRDIDSGDEIKDGESTEDNKVKKGDGNSMKSWNKKEIELDISTCQEKAADDILNNRKSKKAKNVKRDEQPSMKSRTQMEDVNSRCKRETQDPAGLDPNNQEVTPVNFNKTDIPKKFTKLDPSTKAEKTISIAQISCLQKKQDPEKSLKIPNEIQPMGSKGVTESLITLRRSPRKRNRSKDVTVEPKRKVKKTETTKKTSPKKQKDGASVDRMKTDVDVKKYHTRSRDGNKLDKNKIEDVKLEKQHPNNDRRKKEEHPKNEVIKEEKKQHLDKELLNISVDRMIGMEQENGKQHLKYEIQQEDEKQHPKCEYMKIGSNGNIEMNLEQEKQHPEYKAYQEDGRQDPKGSIEEEYQETGVIPEEQAKVHEDFNIFSVTQNKRKSEHDVPVATAMMDVAMEVVVETSLTESPIVMKSGCKGRKLQLSMNSESGINKGKRNKKKQKRKERRRKSGSPLKVKLEKMKKQLKSKEMGTDPGSSQFSFGENLPNIQEHKQKDTEASKEDFQRKDVLEDSIKYSPDKKGHNKEQPPGSVDLPASSPVLNKWLSSGMKKNNMRARELPNRQEKLHKDAGNLKKKVLDPGNLIKSEHQTGTAMTSPSAKVHLEQNLSVAGNLKMNEHPLRTSVCSFSSNSEFSSLGLKKNKKKGNEDPATGVHANSRSLEKGDQNNKATSRISNTIVQPSMPQNFHPIPKSSSNESIDSGLKVRRSEVNISKKPHINSSFSTRETSEKERYFKDTATKSTEYLANVSLFPRTNDLKNIDYATRSYKNAALQCLIHLAKMRIKDLKLKGTDAMEPLDLSLSRDRQYQSQDGSRGTKISFPAKKPLMKKITEIMGDAASQKSNVALGKKQAMDQVSPESPLVHYNKITNNIKCNETSKYKQRDVGKLPGKGESKEEHGCFNALISNKCNSSYIKYRKQAALNQINNAMHGNLQRIEHIENVKKHSHPAEERCFAESPGDDPEDVQQEKFRHSGNKDIGNSQENLNPGQEKCFITSPGDEEVIQVDDFRRDYQHCSSVKRMTPCSRERSERLSRESGNYRKVGTGNLKKRSKQKSKKSLIKKHGNYNRDSEERGSAEDAARTSEVHERQGKINRDHFSKANWRGRNENLSDGYVDKRKSFSRGHPSRSHSGERTKFPSGKSERIPLSRKKKTSRSRSRERKRYYGDSSKMYVFGYEERGCPSGVNGRQEGYANYRSSSREHHSRSHSREMTKIPAGGERILSSDFRKKKSSTSVQNQRSCSRERKRYRGESPSCSYGDQDKWNGGISGRMDVGDSQYGSQTDCRKRNCGGTREKLSFCNKERDRMKRIRCKMWEERYNDNRRWRTDKQDDPNANFKDHSDEDKEWDYMLRQHIKIQELQEEMPNQDHRKTPQYRQRRSVSSQPHGNQHASSQEPRRDSLESVAGVTHRDEKAARNMNEENKKVQQSTLSRSIWMSSLQDCQKRRKKRAQWSSEQSDFSPENQTLRTEMTSSAEKIFSDESLNHEDSHHENADRHQNKNSITTIDVNPEISMMSSSSHLSWQLSEESRCRFNSLAKSVQALSPLKLSPVKFNYRP